MEDSAEFLKMAGSILLFVIALSIILPLFSQARQTSDALIAYSDRESDFYNGYAYLDGSEGEDKYFYNGNESTGDYTNKVRSVGLDTIIPAIYRSYDENYRIIFKKGTIKKSAEPGSKDFFSELSDYNFYQRQDKDGNYVVSNVFDLNEFSIPKENVNEFIEAFLYGKFKEYAEYNSNPQKGFQSYYNIKFDENLGNNPGENNIIENTSNRPNIIGKGLYHKLSEHLNAGNKIYEYMGIYYLEDVEELNSTPVPGAPPSSTDAVPESMKDEKRVITYVLCTGIT